jgi:hypothetical protein
MESIMIYQIDINEDRINLIVHLKDEESGDLFWLVPKETDGSDKWVAIQEWLDQGNEITDTIEYKTLYQGYRKQAYPSLEEQADMQYWDAINGTTTWQDAIQAVKDANPKPTS